MAFLDAAAGGEEGPPPAAPGGPPGGGAPPGNPMQGGGPVLAGIANRQRGPQVSAPGPGDSANSMTQIMQAVAILSQALPGLAPGTPIQQDVLKATQRLSKHVQQGQPTAGVQKTSLMDQIAALAKNAILQMIMSQQRQGGPGGGGQGGQGGPPGAMAQAPMPSTPLPGA